MVIGEVGEQDGGVSRGALSRWSQQSYKLAFRIILFQYKTLDSIFVNLTSYRRTPIQAIQEVQQCCSPSRLHQLSSPAPALVSREANLCGVQTLNKQRHVKPASDSDRRKHQLAGNYCSPYSIPIHKLKSASNENFYYSFKLSNKYIEHNLANMFY